MKFHPYLLIVIVFLMACQEQASPPVQPRVEEETITHAPFPADHHIKVGLLIMNGVYNTELTAPMDIFHHTRFRSDTFMEVFTIAKSLDVITSFENLKIQPDFSYMDTFPEIDILVVPSAEGHLDKDLEDEDLIRFVKEAGEKADYVTSHCDGAFVLAEAGLLDSVECTTFPSDIEAMREMYPHLTIHEDVLFVHDGKFITSAGGAKSFEAALYLHELYFGNEATKRTAEGLVIDWKLEEVPKIIVR